MSDYYLYHDATFQTDELLLGRGGEGILIQDVVAEKRTDRWVRVRGLMSRFDRIANPISKEDAAMILFEAAS